MSLRAFGAVLAALALSACATQAPPLPPVRGPGPPPPVSEPPRPYAPPPAPRTFPLSELKGWDREDHADAFAAFRATCQVSKRSDLAAICREARAVGQLDNEQSRGFFEAHFRAEQSAPAGVLTAYFAPEYEARMSSNAEFSAPVRARPSDMKTVDGGLFDPAQAGRPGVARDPGNGRPLEPYPDRVRIEATAPETVLAWMRPEDLFFLQIQGSGVLIMEDGRRVKALYAANNGQPFIPIARPMREQGLLAADNTSGESIRAWLAANRGPRAQAIMNLNPRYAFFRMAPDDGKQPVGAAGIPLPERRAIAIDPIYHAWGDLFWIDGEAPILVGAFPTYRHLVTALDTGGAIKGEVRADLYMGLGALAGAEAGRVRHTLKMYRLVPQGGRP